MSLSVVSRVENGLTVLFDKGIDKIKTKASVRTNDAGRVCVEAPKTQVTWLTVGVRLILGVGLVSNLCMGVLIYTNWKSTQEVSDKTNALLDLNAGLNAELRESISQLQAKYLKIPDMLTVDPAGAVKKQIQAAFTLDGEEILEGRPNYGKYFKRRQRRDISKGKFVVQVKDGQLIVSKGLTDDRGQFTDNVSMMYIQTLDPQGDMDKIKTIIRTEEASADSEDALKKKIAELNARLADEGLAAEEARTKILYHVDQIRAQEDDLGAFRAARQKTMMLIAGITIALNLIVLYIMTSFHVERPLKKLTQTIEQINAGESVSIPYQKRKDKIGVLAGVLQSFQGALQNLRAADERKQREQAVIQELILTMTQMIEDLQTKSQAMKTASFDLYELAGKTNDQSDTATTAIGRTEQNTDSVAHAAGSLQNSVQNIHAQVETQNDLVTDINKVTRRSMDNIQDLNTASQEIEEIIKIVKNIAGQTKLLALNARIEASRAGDAGKGFAVVANEVRDLSLQTEAANQEIEAKISAIQSACSQMIESTQGVESLVGTLSEAGTRIFDSVKDQRDLSDMIARNAEATSDDVHDLSERVTTVKDAARETRRLSEDVRTHSSDMEAALGDLLAGAQEKLGQIGDNTSLTIC
ncbi:MAG TPA: hypothetical protein DHV36_00740 [Desulfobacteraceae bacterium]|nr:hypothetical protein [Desulfobacteraceae bacterium]